MTLAIDPYHGTVKVRELKARLCREKWGHPEKRDFGLGVYENSVAFEEAGFTITLRLEDDEMPRGLDEDEALGEFSEYPSEKPGEYVKVEPDSHAMFRLVDAGIVGCNVYGEAAPCYWTNSRTGSVADTREYASRGKAGMSRGVADEWARENQRMFYERALRTIEGDISYVGVVATASRAGVEMGSASLWGIESDAGDYFNEVATDLVSEAIAYANEEIDALIKAAARVGGR